MLPLVRRLTAGAPRRSWRPGRDLHHRGNGPASVPAGPVESDLGDELGAARRCRPERGHTRALMVRDRSGSRPHARDCPARNVDSDRNGSRSHGRCILQVAVAREPGVGTCRSASPRSEVRCLAHGVWWPSHPSPSASCPTSAVIDCSGTRGCRPIRGAGVMGNESTSVTFAVSARSPRGDKQQGSHPLRSSRRWGRLLLPVSAHRRPGSRNRGGRAFRRTRLLDGLTPRFSPR